MTGKPEATATEGPAADRSAALPVDPDIEADGSTAAGPFTASRPRWPRLRAGVLAAVFVGGCVGGGIRYAATTELPSPAGGFPWATFAVNLAGAFVLSLVVVAAAELAPSRYLRPLVGTGFCGGLTTFSSVVVTADQMLAHGHRALAAAYVSATLAGALAAASFGLVLARAVVTNRRRARDEGSRS